MRPRPGRAAAEADQPRATRRSTSAPRWCRSRRSKSGLKVELSNGEVTTFDGILVAVGRRPNGHAIDAAAAGVERRRRGLHPGRPELRTNVPWIHAIGDIAGGPMLAHKAAHEGRAAAEVIAGLPGAAFDARTVPSVAFTDPEIAWMGLTETAARRAGDRVREGRVPVVGLRPSPGTRTRRGPDQAAVRARRRAPARRRHRRASNAGDLIAETVHALEMGADAEDIGLTIHPHPTLSETIGFAAEVAAGTITDLLPRPSGVGASAAGDGASAAPRAPRRAADREPAPGPRAGGAARAGMALGGAASRTPPRQGCRGAPRSRSGSSGRHDRSVPELGVGRRHRERLGREHVVSRFLGWGLRGRRHRRMIPDVNDPGRSVRRSGSAACGARPRGPRRALPASTCANLSRADLDLSPHAPPRWYPYLCIVSSYRK